jgi:serine/threonine protein kinase
MHVDCNSEQHILVFDYFQDTLLSLLKHDPGLPSDERPKILRSISEAVYELHSQGWVHTGQSNTCVDGSLYMLIDRNRYQAR